MIVLATAIATAIVIIILQISRFKMCAFLCLRAFLIVEISRFQDFKISRFQDFKISNFKYQDSKMCAFLCLRAFLIVEISRFRDFKISRFRDFKNSRFRKFKISKFQFACGRFCVCVPFFYVRTRRVETAKKDGKGNRALDHQITKHALFHRAMGLIASFWFF